jgi:hypothetical protein
MANKLTPKQVKKKVESLKADRGTLDTHVQEIFDFMLPRKATVTTQQTPGAKRSVFVLDNTGMYCLELLAGQLHGLLTSPNGMWFELTTGVQAIDQRDDVRFWLQKTSRDIHNVLNNSNFQTEVHELYIDEVSAGTACMYSEEDDRDVVRFSTKFFGEYYVDEDAQGRVNQIYRVWKWKAAQLVEEFGIDNVSKKVQKSYEKGDDHKFEVIHACYPKSLVNPKDKAGFEHVSQYLLAEEEFELRSEGYREFPYVVPRWSKGTGEKYGRSPAMVALPEVKTLNKMAETMLIGAQKVIDPPLQMPDDGFVLPIITTPGGINYYRPGGNDKIEPIFNDTRIDFGYEAMKEKRTRIREAFFVDQLMLQQGPQMTATEVLQRTEEKMRLLGPMLGRQQSEFLRPLIDRVFNIMMRRGIIKKDEIPQVLRGRKIDVKYSSMIAKSQRLQDGQNIMRTLQAATPFINLDASVADNINGDAALRVLGEVYGLPQQILRNEDDVKHIREQRAQAQQKMIEEQQQAQQIDNAQKGVGMMGELSKTQNQG